jgi:hypothetical protein
MHGARVPAAAAECHAPGVTPTRTHSHRPMAPVMIPVASASPCASEHVPTLRRSARTSSFALAPANAIRAPAFGANAEATECAFDARLQARHEQDHQLVQRSAAPAARGCQGPLTRLHVTSRRGASV